MSDPWDEPGKRVEGLDEIVAVALVLLGALQQGDGGVHHVAGQEAVFKTKVDAKRLDSDVLHSDKEVQGGRKNPERLPEVSPWCIFEVMTKHINTGMYSWWPINRYPYLLEDSSMMSRRFSLIDASMELNFCFTCFRGSLFNGSRKTSHTVHRFTLFLVVYTQTPSSSLPAHPMSAKNSWSFFCPFMVQSLKLHDV